MNPDYPNDGEAVGIYEVEPDKEQTKAARKESADVGASLPIMEQVLEWFDQQITLAKSIEEVEIDDKMTDSQIARQVMVQKMVAKKLTEKQEELKSKHDAWQAEREQERGA